MNGWQFLFAMFLGVLAYKALEMICFMIIAIFACFTNGKNQSLEVLLNMPKGCSKSKGMRDVAKMSFEPKTRSERHKKGE